jgi:hypothetical protein
MSKSFPTSCLGLDGSLIGAPVDTLEKGLVCFPYRSGKACVPGQSAVGNVTIFHTFSPL